jgi:hypothetical protein
VVSLTRRRPDEDGTRPFPVGPAAGESGGSTISVPSWTSTRSGEAAGRESGEAAERIGTLLRTDRQTVTEP